jgi:hypothetical protein
MEIGRIGRRLRKLEAMDGVDQVDGGDVEELADVARARFGHINEGLREGDDIARENAEGEESKPIGIIRGYRGVRAEGRKCVRKQERRRASAAHSKELDRLAEKSRYSVVYILMEIADKVHGA